LSTKITSCSAPSLRPRFVAATTPPLPPPNITICFRLPFRAIDGDSFGRLLFCRTAPLLGPKRQSSQISQSLVAPLFLFPATLGGKLFSEAGSCVKKEQNQFVGEIPKPFHKFHRNRRAILRNWKFAVWLEPRGVSNGGKYPPAEVSRSLAAVLAALARPRR
jgi:hypothetical protein